MNRLLRRTLVGVCVGIVVYAIMVLVLDVGALVATLDGYRWDRFLLALLASSLNYALRFVKWELCLGWLAVRHEAPGLTRSRSALIYLAGLSMSVTPGKLGEVLRSTLLRASDGVAFTRTAPIVVVDRLTDLVALVLLSLVGIARFGEYVPVLVATMLLVLTVLAVLGSPRVLRRVLAFGSRSARLARWSERAEALVDSSQALLRGRALAVLTLLSVAGWGLECLGYYWVVSGFEVARPELLTSAFLWATTTLVGALSFLPGGLGATEASLAVLAAQVLPGVTPTIGVSSTLLIRGATLWYGELVGGLCLLAFLRDPLLRRRMTEDSPSGPVAPAASS